MFMVLYNWAFRLLHSEVLSLTLLVALFSLQITSISIGYNMYVCMYIVLYH